MYALCVSSEKRLTIMQKTNDGNKYIGIDILHNVNPSIRADNFTLRNVNVYEFDGENFTILPNTSIVTGGEWDCAIKELGKSDFMGGISHGDEVYTSVVAFVDGKLIDIDNDNFLMECNEVDFYTKSHLLEVDNPVDNILAQHDKKFIINKSGIYVEQRVKFLQSIELDNSYLLMLPIARDISGVYVTNKGYMDNDYAIKDLSNQGNVITGTKAKSVTIYNQGAGHQVKARVELIDSNNETDDFWMFLPTSAYNKIYQRFVHNKTTEINEVWYCKAKFNIEYSGFVEP